MVVTSEAYSCVNELPTMAMRRPGVEPMRPVDYKSSALTTTLPSLMLANK